MANTRTYSRSFAGGVISTEMFGRIDDAKYQSGAAKLKNFIAAPTGVAENRAGFAFVKATKVNGRARLIPFTFALNQTMVIELGDFYARFHTNGGTLQYDVNSLKPWIDPSPDLAYTMTAPGVFTWASHGLITGDPIRFYLYGSSNPGALPGGLQLAYTYTVQKIDADTFSILDADGNVVALTPPAGGGGGGFTNYPGTGSPGLTMNLAPNQSSAGTPSGSAGGLASVVVADRIATLNVNLTATVYAFQAGGAVQIQYSADNGATWNSFFGIGTTYNQTISHPISIGNLDQFKVRLLATGGTGPSGSLSISATINSWSIDVPTGATPAGPNLRAYRYYTAGDAVTHDHVGPLFLSWVAVKTDSGGLSTPGTDPTIWAALPFDGTYEIPTPFAIADVFNVHYAQSADVLTLVHPNYPPQELKRLSATSWSMTAIQFGPPLAAPLSVTAVASPGFLARVSTISLANPALFTTESPHTLAVGDGTYLANITKVVGGVSTVIDGFYMVSNIPVDGSGELIPNELHLADYNGKVVDSSGWTSYHATDGSKPISLQFGTKIFNITNDYAVQAFAADGVAASALSDSASILNNLDVPGSYNTIGWAAVDGAKTYNVYKKFNGLWGFIGTTDDLSFVDDNIAPDFTIVPGTPDTVFDKPGNYPGAVCYVEQRRAFAGSINGPDNCWMTNSGTEKMFSYSLPSRATDRIAFRVAALKADQILHLVPMTQLLMLTSETEYAVQPANADVLTPSNIDARPNSYIGASQVQPTVINTSMVYAAARGGHVRELAYAWTVNGFQTGDLSLRAGPLFNNFTIVDQAYSKSPRPIIWFVSSNGNLLGLTYIPEEQLGAWHQHVTQGSFESICCVAEGSEDVLYAVVNRTINGSTVRYVERMASRVIDPDDSSTWFFVDAGITQTFLAPVTQVTGLTWLEGATVAVLADGGVQQQKVVTAGKITLDHAATTVTIGLPYDADLKTLPLVLQLDGFGQGRTKNINRVWLKVYRSSGISLGPTFDDLTEYKQRTDEPFGSPPELMGTGEDDSPEETEPIVVTPMWEKSGQLCVRQSSPLPLSVVAVTMEVSIGG